MDTPRPPGPVVKTQQKEGLPLSTIWPRAAQWLVAFLLGVTAVLLAFHAYGSTRWATRPTTLEQGPPLTYRVDLNQAGRAELMQLPGVGDSLAGQIEDYRRQYGAFKSVDELIQVRGIGPTTLQRLRPWLCVAGDALANDRAAGRSAAPRGEIAASPKQVAKPRNTSKEANLRGPIDVNEASEQELQQLPGIGPARAQRIVEERERRRFQSVEDLRRVSGIGAKTLDRLRPYIMLDKNAADAKAPPVTNANRVQ
jgi:competence protein ComEA